MTMKRDSQIKFRDTITFEADKMIPERYSFIKLLSSVYNLTPNQSDDLHRIYKKTSGKNNRVLFQNYQYENIIIGIMSYVMKDTELNMHDVITATYNTNIKYQTLQIYRVSSLLSEIIDGESLYIN